MRTQFLAAATGLLVVTTISMAATQEPPAPQARVPTPEDRQSDTLVQTRGQEQASKQQAIADVGRSGQLTALRAIVRNYFRAPAKSRLAITGSESLDAINAEEIALLLTMLGYDPSSLQSDQGRAARLIQSATNAALGQSTIKDEMEISPIVVVARLSNVNRDASLSDGHRSTATFQVIESIKGNIGAGSTMQIRQRSGPMNNQIILLTNEFQPGMAGDYLLFLSPDMYRVRAKGRSAPTSSSTYYSMFLLPYVVREGAAIATSGGQNSSGFNISSLRAS